MKKLHEDSTWKDAHPAPSPAIFSHSRCMKEYFIMTAHWIEIGGSPLAPSWELRHRVLGSYAVQDLPIGHQGACIVCMPPSQTKLLLSLRHSPNYCLVVYVQSLLGLLVEQCRLFQLHVDFPAIVTDCMWQHRQGFQQHPWNGIGSAVDAISYTMS